MNIPLCNEDKIVITLICVFILNNMEYLKISGHLFNKIRQQYKQTESLPIDNAIHTQGCNVRSFS